MVETALSTSAAARFVPGWRTLATTILLALLAVLVGTGNWPELRSKVSFAPKGLVSTAPAEIQHVEIRTGLDAIALHREAPGWALDGANTPIAPELASHLETALRLIHVSEPAREISSTDLTAASFAEFGLDPPINVAVLRTRSGTAATVNFGALNPASTSHYVRLGGSPTVYLMPRHVGDEWRIIIDMERRLGGQIASAATDRSSSLLLPVSLTQVWALEIVYAGKLTRFERDNAGNWFRHVGQHSHAAGGGHAADPEQARIIDSALRAFDTAAVERRIGPADAAQVAAYGLVLPTMIVMLYGRDSSAALARLEFGAATEKLDRYARLAPNGVVVTVAEFELRRLTELLRAVGAGT